LGAAKSLANTGEIKMWYNRVNSPPTPTQEITMIVTHLNELSAQSAQLPGLQQAIHFIQQSAGQDLPDGRVEIDGKNVYALIQSYNSKLETENPRFEAHRKYVDVQYIVSGKELIGWAPLAALSEATPYNDEKDVLHGRVSADALTLTRLSAGQATLLYPSDAHAPGLADGESTSVKKIVVKIALHFPQ
jgi:biofilm protein TabA